MKLCHAHFQQKDIVSNTTVLINLSAIDRLDLLRVFETIYVPSEVRDEFLRGMRRSSELAVKNAMEDGSWIQVETADRLPLAAVLQKQLDPGESEAIALAIAKELPIMTDDLDARTVARAYDLEVTGSLGVIAMAKRRNVIAEAKPLCLALRESGTRLRTSLIERFLAGLGESL